MTFKTTQVLRTKGKEEFNTIEEARRIARSAAQENTAQESTLSRDVQTQTNTIETNEIAIQTDPDIENLSLLSQNIQRILRDNGNNNNISELRQEIGDLLELLPPPTQQLTQTQVPILDNNSPNDLTPELDKMEKVIAKMGKLIEIQKAMTEQLLSLSQHKIFWATAVYLMGYLAYNLTPGVFWREFGKYFTKYYTGKTIDSIKDWFSSKELPNVDFGRIIERHNKDNPVMDATIKALKKIFKKWS